MENTELTILTMQEAREIAKLVKDVYDDESGGAIVELTEGNNWCRLSLAVCDRFGGYVTLPLTEDQVVSLLHQANERLSSESATMKRALNQYKDTLSRREMDGDTKEGQSK